MSGKDEDYSDDDYEDEADIKPSGGAAKASTPAEEVEDDDSSWDTDDDDYHKSPPKAAAGPASNKGGGGAAAVNASDIKSEDDSDWDDGMSDDIDEHPPKSKAAAAMAAAKAASPVKKVTGPAKPAPAPAPASAATGEDDDEDSDSDDSDEDSDDSDDSDGEEQSAPARAQVGSAAASARAAGIAAPGPSSGRPQSAGGNRAMGPADVDIGFNPSSDEEDEDDVIPSSGAAARAAPALSSAAQPLGSATAAAVTGPAAAGVGGPTTIAAAGGVPPLADPTPVPVRTMGTVDGYTVTSSPFQLYASLSYMSDNDNLKFVANGPANIADGNGMVVKYLKHAFDVRTLKSIPTMCFKAPAMKWCGPRWGLVALTFLIMIIGGGIANKPDPTHESKEKSEGIGVASFFGVLFCSIFIGTLLEFVPDRLCPEGTAERPLLFKRLWLNSFNLAFNAFWLLVQAGSLVRSLNAGVVSLGAALLFFGHMLILPYMYVMFAFWHNSIDAPGSWLLTPPHKGNAADTVMITVTLMSLFLSFTALASSLGMVYVASEGGGAAKSDPPRHYNAAFGMGVWVCVLSIIQAFFTVYVGAGTDIARLAKMSSNKLLLLVAGLFCACIGLFIIVFYGIAQQ